MKILNMDELVGFTKRQIVLAYRELAHEYMAIAIVCDVCGAPATNQAVDFKEVSGPLDTIERYERDGEPKKGCDKHRVSSVVKKYNVP